MTLEHPENRVVLAGILDPRRRRNQLLPANVRRTAQGGRVSEFALQIDSPYGEPFAAMIATSATTTGSELLDQEHLNTPIYVEAMLQTRVAIDARYALDDSDIGRVSREMMLRATAIRPLADGEVSGTSAVWLDGVVMSDARFGFHRSATAIQLARIVLRVRWPRQSGYIGSNALIYEEADINLSIPVGLSGAAYALRPGNRLRVLGQLDSVLVPLRGSMVEERLEREAQSWQQRKATLTDVAILRTETRRYRSMRQRLSERALLSVIAAQIEVDAAARPGDLDEALEKDTQRRRGNQERTESEPGSTVTQPEGSRRPRRRVAEEPVLPVEG